MDFVKTVKDIMDKRYAEVKKSVGTELNDRSSSAKESMKKELMADRFTKDNTETKTKEEKYQALADCIRSEQQSAGQVVAEFNSDPDIYQWYKNKYTWKDFICIWISSNNRWYV